MDVSEWHLYHKINLTNMERETTQMVYEPRISSDYKTFCMNFNIMSNYQYKQTKLFHEEYNEDFISYMFDREIEYLTRCSKFKWIPEILDINTRDRQIFLKWYNHTCNDLLYNKETIDNNLIKYCIEQFKKILKEQLSKDIFKISMYPHSYYLDNDGQMRSIDFYACCTESNHIIELNKIKPLLGDSVQRFLECTTDTVVDLKRLYINTLKHHNLWPKGTLENIYEEFFWQH